MIKVYTPEDSGSFVMSAGLRINYEACLDSIPFEHDDQDTEFFYLNLEQSGEIGLRVELDRHPDVGPRASLKDVYSNPIYQPIREEHERLCAARTGWAGICRDDDGETICSRAFPDLDQAIAFAASEHGPRVTCRSVRAYAVD